LAQYRESNPWYAESLPATAGEAAPMFLGQGVALGAVFGLLVGGVTWALRRWVTKG